MTTSADVSLRELDGLDLLRDIPGRMLHVTADGAAWSAVPVPDLPPRELLELYYWMTLTRAVDIEIVKLSRKGLAFGKHLMCTGNDIHESPRSTAWPFTAEE